jgi:UPF0042 nucleotide-binding protein
MDIILITGMSGSGKSVALHALEDAGYYCVDNLPPELLIPFVKLEEQQQEPRLAIAIDVRSANSLHLMPEQMAILRDMGMTVKSLFLDSSSDTLMRRYSETRRKHPLSGGDKPQNDKDLAETIAFERELLSDLRQNHGQRPLRATDPGVRILCVQTRHSDRCGLCVRCAHAAQPAL